MFNLKSVSEKIQTERPKSNASVRASFARFACYPLLVKETPCQPPSAYVRLRVCALMIVVYANYSGNKVRMKECMISSGLPPSIS